MLHELTLSGLTSKLASKEVSSREAMQACLDRIAAVDGQVNAFMSIDRDDALGQADAADAALAKGKSMPLTDLATATKSHEVIFAADLSAKKNRPVKLSELRA